ncbi:hypothetical protein BCV69DRAFT_300586 [Microstroma glucosiphilum]|uniref:Uncharacterized protein n=1 Tax=Pseudomicrostroma glucosiphilum TaxID=1684307 RepID=A0A316U1K6_9BASI|nr:hypothetical protein BCV69DRAFT_300586 [Pseudomicrostroma glucosiphilum]PWN19266.1 hypothetical protein BCV69DRAFT_300586 [Pseudomicrostroma glucosiphilum]
MVRGHAKAEAKEAAAKRAAGGKGSGKSQLGEARETALRQFKCQKCMIGIPSYKSLILHWESKHPKDPIPPESSF